MAECFISSWVTLTLTLTLTPFLHSSFFVSGAYPIRFTQMCLMLDQFLWGQTLVSVTFLVYLSHDIASGSDITPCNKIDKPLKDLVTLRNVIYYNAA